MISAQKSSWLVTIARAIPGLAATAPAVTAVTARPATIQPYTARRNAPTCSAPAAGLRAAAEKAPGAGVSDSILASPGSKAGRDASRKDGRTEGGGPDVPSFRH